MPAKVYAVINQKGGVGKTTTALALWAKLNATGNKALAIDLDAQCNFTFTARGSTEGLTAFTILTAGNDAPALDAIQHAPAGDIIAGSRALAGADAYITETGKEYRLKEAIAPLLDKYDYIIIDTPPALGILTVNALTACNAAIIPAQADIYSIQGIAQLMDTIRPVKQYCNPGLTIAGVLLTRYNARTVLAREAAEQLHSLAAQIGTKVFNTPIRESTTVKEAQLKREPICTYSPAAAPDADYTEFLKELTEEGEKPQ